MKVLIVDDSMVIRERIIFALSEITGRDALFEAENVLGAARAVKQLDPDIVILDIRMPHGSGIDVLQFMRNINSTTKVIILTNYPHEHYREKCMSLGADYFFDKSTEFERVFEVVEQLTIGMTVQS